MHMFVCVSHNTYKRTFVFTVVNIPLLTAEGQEERVRLQTAMDRRANVCMYVCMYVFTCVNTWYVCKYLCTYAVQFCFMEPLYSDTLVM